MYKLKLLEEQSKKPGKKKDDGDEINSNNYDEWEDDIDDANYEDDDEDEDYDEEECKVDLRKPKELKDILLEKNI